MLASKYFRMVLASLRTLVHEMGHNLAKARLGGTQLQNAVDYPKAVRSQELPPAEYTAENIAEDFAESVSLYWTDWAKLKRDAPMRFSIIDKLFKNPRYHG